jgi:hypothetical protein
MFLNVIRWFDPVRFYTALFYLEIYMCSNNNTAELNRNEHYELMKNVLLKNNERILLKIQDARDEDMNEYMKRLHTLPYLSEIVKWFNIERDTDAPEEMRCMYMPTTEGPANPDNFLNILLEKIFFANIYYS